MEAHWKTAENPRIGGKRTERYPLVIIHFSRKITLLIYTHTINPSKKYIQLYAINRIGNFGFVFSFFQLYSYIGCVIKKDRIYTILHIIKKDKHNM